MAPPVSVLLPFRNAAAMLDACIDSIRAQDMDAFEVLCIDDGSTDDGPTRIAAGGYRDGDFPEDYELWLRLHAAGEVLAKLPQTLLHWRDGPGRLSRTDLRYARIAFDRLRAGYLARDPRLLAARSRLVIWGAGRRTRRRGAHLLGHGFRPRAWIDIDPRKIGNRLAGVPVVDPSWLRRRPRPFVLSYVASHGARPCIEAELSRLGYRKGEDYLHVG